MYNLNKLDISWFQNGKFKQSKNRKFPCRQSSDLTNVNEIWYFNNFRTSDFRKNIFVLKILNLEE